MTEVGPIRSFLRRLASFGLPGTDAAALDVSEKLWARALAPLEWEKLSGLAVAAMQAAALSLPEQQARALLDWHREAMLHALRLERHLLRLGEAFEEAGVDIVVLKGPAVAHTMYPDPSWRPFGDLDILVRDSDWRRACSLLPELGFGRKFPEPRPGFVERFGHTAAHMNDGGLEVDLHRTLVGGPFGLWMDGEELFDHTEPFELGGRKFQRLDDTALFMHACVHASLGYRPPLLLPLRDVAQVASRGEPDRERLADWGRRWKLTVVYRHAAQALSTMLDVRLPDGLGLGSEERTPGRERRALEAYTTMRRSRGGKAVSSLRAIRGVRAKATYVGALLFPSREFLRFRSIGDERHRSYLRRWMVLLRRSVGGRRRQTT